MKMLITSFNGLNLSGFTVKRFQKHYSEPRGWPRDLMPALICAQARQQAILQGSVHREKCGSDADARSTDR